MIKQPAGVSLLVKAGGDRREVVTQRAIDGFFLGKQHGFVLRGKARREM